MPINSSSTPALMVARKLRRRKRAAGGGIFDYSGVGAAMPEAYGADAPVRDLAYTVPKSIIYDLPKKAIEQSAQNPMPGLRREDFTDAPADTSPDERSAFGGIGVKVPKVGWQPVDPMVGASLEAAGNMAGASVPFAKQGTVGVFGGRLAKTADHEALARAEKMMAEGVPPEQIWKDTGWFKGPDDQWRFEINDRGSGYKRSQTPNTIDNYKISLPHTTEMGAAYQHPELYAAYPDLEKMQLDFRPLGGAHGQYVRNEPSPGDLIPPHEAVTINTPRDRYGENMVQARSTTLHELQHAVQRREGFVPGGNPSEMREVVQAGIDARFLRGAEDRGIPPEEALAAFRKELGRDPHPAASKIASDMSMEDLERIANDPLEAYRRLYGEVEARNVQQRRDLTPETRRSIYPRSSEDIPPELQTLGRNRPGRGGQMSDVDRVLEDERKLSGASNEPRPAEPAAAKPAAAAGPESVGPGGGGALGARGLPEAQAAAARWAGNRQPLEGIPGPMKIGEDYFVPGPIGKIHDVAEDYMRTHRPEITYTPATKVHPIDPEHSAAIAQAYEEMKHTPKDPATVASYNALIDETAKQYEAIKKTGLKIEPIPAGAPDPYAANPRLAAIDVAENNHLWFFPTEGGFGTVNKITDNPMLRKTGEKIGDHELLANDMFRVVHDYFGHLKHGHGFRAAGEDNAWRTHSGMYSDLARPAMTTETRGQNSWVNYGPHGEKNRTASGADTTYADQKVGLMPDWTMYDKGKEPIYAYHGSPHSFNKFDISKIGDGEGAQVYGHGLYFAENPKVAKAYREQLSKHGAWQMGGDKVQGHHIDDLMVDAIHKAAQGVIKPENMFADLPTGEIVHAIATQMGSGKTVAQIKKRPPAFESDIHKMSWNAAVDALEKAGVTHSKNPGATYKVAIEADPHKFLDWDATLRNQPPHIRERVQKEMEESVANQKAALQRSIEKTKGELERAMSGAARTHQGRSISPRAPYRIKSDIEDMERRLATLDANELPGKEIYKRMGLPAKDPEEMGRKASSALLARDIPGLRYFDQGSRNLAQGAKSRNIVTFNDDIVRILRKYGITAVPAAGVAAGAAKEDNRAAGGRAVRRAMRRRAEGGEVTADDMMDVARERISSQPSRMAMDWSKYNQPFGELRGTSPEDTPTAFKTRHMKITEGDIDRAINVGLAASTSPTPSRGVVARMADDTGAAMRVARDAKKYAEPEYNPSGGLIYNKGVENPPNPAVQTVADPHRMMFPGVYRNPRHIADEAAARVGPEDPAMKQLFGVTRGDLREMAKGRVGNEEPNLRLAKNPKGSLSAQNIQTPQNTQRLQDILGEAGRHEGLRTADAWYLMDPVYKRMVELFGPEEAARRYKMFNTSTAMASPGSDVMTEIQRGTGAHWLHNQGRFDDFTKFAGVPEEFRSRTAGFPQDMRYIGGHSYHRTAQAGPMQKFFETGAIQSDAPKVPLYAHASGVPETGFQTSGPVGDAHFSRGVGLTDTRKGPTDVQGSFSRAEYQTLQPWWQHEVAGPSGLESVPAQARLWTVLGPQTGVESALGAPKLELLSQQIMAAARRLRISPEQARDLVLSGQAGAGLLGGAIAAPVIADAMRDHHAAGGSVDAAMAVARSIKRAKGGKVHVGPIIGDTGGRADKVPMEVPDGAYVLTADHVSGLGEGNTEAGMKRLSEMFPKSKPSAMRKLPHEPVPIYAADGEFVISPEDILDRFGDLDYGHKSLDAWQTSERQHLIKTLEGLDPPAQD